MKIAILIILTFFVNMEVGYCQEDKYWVLKRDKNNIKVYTHHVDKSNVVDFKIVATVNAPVSQVAALLFDVESYPDWTPNLKATEILKQINNADKYYYAEINAPWPVSNRDNIIHFQAQEDSITKVVKISMKGIPDYICEKPGIVRILSSHGVWELIPMQNGETKILTVHSTDLSGSLPVWVFRIFVVGGIYNMFVNMKEVVKEDKYKQ